MSWPPNLPDLSQIEHIWEVMGQQLRVQRPPIHNISDLRDRCLNIWYNVSPAIYQGLVVSMPRRVEAVLRAKGSEDQTQSKPCFCNDQEDLKQQPSAKIPKDVLSDSGLDRAGHSIRSKPCNPPDTLHNPSLRSCIIIHQNEVVTNSSSIWADIWIKDLIPISKTSYGSSMEHMQVWPPSESLPKTRHPVTVSFNSVGLMVLEFPQDQ
ncbi:transposase domain containing protein [Trichonephila clavipes]|nr:transposase domain containing protein [Trichonephila clavipes]